MAFQAHHYVRIDRSKRLAAEPGSGHNRWHPDIAPVVSVEEGEIVGIETRDAFDGQIGERCSAQDVAKVNINLVHPLTGPVYVKGAEPGDCLEVNIIEIAPQSTAFTVQVPGFGFLRDLFHEPFVVHWRIDGTLATSNDLPGVRISAAPFMGVIGVAPSKELLGEINRRETDLHKRGGAVFLSEPADAVPSGPLAATGLRTIAPHETGGNLDIKQLTKGTTLRIPVFVPGALFSVGDAHFAQGDNESCGTAVEMGATFYGSFKLIKGGAAKLGQRDVSFYRNDYFAPPELAVPKRFFATTGQSYTRDGVNHSEDATLAARNALLNMIEYLVGERGFTREQAYTICSVAVDLRISQMVDVPNFVVTALLPLAIFK